MKIFFFILLSAISLNISAQVTQEWVSRYNTGTINDFVTNMDMKLDNSGNIYVIGISKGTGTQEDFATIKYNSNGVQQWASRYNGTDNSIDEPSSMAIDVSGNVYVTGSSYTAASGYDFSTIKYNSAGVQEWAVKYNGDSNGFDISNSIAVDNLGNVYVTGKSTGASAQNRSDFTTIKYNSAGVRQWVMKYCGAANQLNEGMSVAIDIAGNIYVAGKCSEYSYQVDYCVIKYNPAGVQLWKDNYNAFNIGYDFISSMALDAAGNLYVTGSGHGSGTGLDYQTIKYSTSGTRLWIARYAGSTSDDRANSIAVDNLGNVYVTGQSLINGLFGCATVKYNSAGVQQWVAFYESIQQYSASANAVKLDASGNVYITGRTSQSSEFGYYDYITVKYNSAGERQWFQKYNGTGNYYDEGICIDVDITGNVIVAGYSDGTTAQHNKDITTIKYSQSVGIIATSNNIPAVYSISQNYPNPFNPTTKIKFDLPGSSFVKLNIFDINGRMISGLVNGNLQAGSYETEFNGANFTSGIYYYRIEAGSFTETKKMILMK